MCYTRERAYRRRRNCKLALAPCLSSLPPTSFYCTTIAPSPSPPPAAAAAATNNRLSSVFTRCLHRSPSLHCHVRRLSSFFPLRCFVPALRSTTIEGTWTRLCVLLDCFRRVASTRLYRPLRSFYILFFSHPFSSSPLCNCLKSRHVRSKQ